MVGAQAARSMLFVPGIREDRFATAVASGADEIVLDLEDGVARQDKDVARREVVRWKSGGGAGIVRINPPDTDHYAADMDAVRSLGSVGVMVPKACARSVLAVAEHLPARAYLIAIIETARGVLEARQVCSIPQVQRLAFGNGDLALELGLSHDNWAGLQWARSTVVCASAAEGCPPPIDGVVTAPRDEALLRTECASGRDLGFTGKLAIHPIQIPTINNMFAPSEGELAWAHTVVAAGSAGGAVLVAGEMIDGPILQRAKNIVERAAATGLEQHDGRRTERADDPGTDR